jgi:serine/threonine protein kinase/predicted Zn-dependent protease
MDCDSTFGVEPDQMRQLFEIGLDETDLHSDEDASPITCWDLMNEKSGSRIGGYRLLHIIGEGGMGIVYLAEQNKPIKRQVALKVVKPGMDSASVVARFETERQALARLNHPNIAHVYDAGTTESGRPYFVMEYVKGVPITEYCDYHRLTIEERLNLFILVCHAVQHAHQKGIIHRDIKPSNILVYNQNDQAVPKIIDFGVAKATAQPLTERTFVTEQGQLLGTPEYMSPEQVDMASLDIDTRSDVYSLGAVLYELLSGTQPFDSESLRESGFDAMRQTIIEQDPLRPSTQLHGMEADVKKIAENRSAEVGTLIKCLAKELEWIPLKAMRKEPAHRYQSASELADDIDNYLNGVPLIAGPESTIYRMQKFVRRHRVPLLATGAVIISLIAGLVISTTMYLLAQQALDKVTSLESRIEVDRNLITTQRLYAAGRYEAALEQIQRILEKRDLGPKGQLLYAQLLFEVGRLADAEQKLQPLVKGGPEIAGAAYSLLARINLEFDPAKARDYRQHAEAMLPQSAEAYSLRAMTAPTPEEALQWLSKALMLDPTHYESRKARALLCCGLRDYQSMAQDVEVLIALRPEDFLGYALRAIVRRETGRFDEALEGHSRAIETCTLATELPTLYSERCETYSLMGNHEAALQDARRCVSLQPDEFSYRFRVFIELVSLKEYDAASREYKQIVGKSRNWYLMFQAWDKKYVFALLRAGLPFEVPADAAHKVPFSTMCQAANYYRMLEATATYLPVSADAPCSWSPDGKQLAYERGAWDNPGPPAIMEAAPVVSRTRGIYILNIETGSERLLATFGMHPAWSPDGEYVAFTRGSHITRTRQEEIFVVRVSGGEPKQLAFGYWPVWGKDTNRLFFRSVDDMLCRIDVDTPGDSPETLLECPGYFAISPDERYVAIGCENSNEVRIVELSSDSVIARWTPPLIQFSWPVKWSPNGKELSLGYWTWYTELGLWIYDIERKKAWQILDAPARSSVWSPDGSKMAVHVLDEVWLVKLDPNIPTYRQLGIAVAENDFMTEELERQSHTIEMDSSYAEHYLRRAVLYIACQQYDRANIDLERCGRMIMSSDDPVLTMMPWWADTFKRYGLYEGAELLNLQTIAIWERIQKTESMDISRQVEALINLYKAWGKPEEAEKWQAKLLQTAAKIE